MSEFVLDTSGFVIDPMKPETNRRHAIWWADLSLFEQGYIEALLRSFVVDDPDILEAAERTGVSPYAGFSDLAPSTLEAIRKDCAEHQAATKAVLGVAQSDAEAGRAFWNFRQSLLPQPSLAFPPLHITLHDDGKVYLQPKGEGA